MKTGLLCLVLVFGAFAAEKKDKVKKWDFQNNPYRIDKNFEATFSKLPLSGDISKSGFGWPGYHWALNKGMISERWSAKRSRNFKYESPSLAELLSMPQAKIDELSPAEKFDIYMQNYRYPTVKRARGMSSRSAGEWTGICHGVSPAGLHHKEPKLTTVTNADGVKLTFYASDLKALLAHYYAKVSDTGVTQIGRRCFAGKYNPIKTRGCRDVNPASFHIIMTNRLGLTTDGFIADVDKRRKVWNHVAVKYNTVIAKRTAREVIVKSKVFYTGVVKPSQNAMLGTDKEKWLEKNYEYSLSLDSQGKIIGGKWLGKDMPDFVWIKDKETFADPYYGKVLELL